MWNRPYVPRLRCSDLPWLPTEALAPALTPGTALRVLSRDMQTGASTCLWRIPPAWRHPAPFSLGAGESLFVLEGDLREGTVSSDAGCFSHLPAGYVHDGLSSRDGAVVLAMWDGPLVPHEPAGRIHSGEEPLRRIDTRAMSGVRTFVAGPEHGITVKLLRTDPVTGGMTLLVDIAAGWTETRSRHHDCVEESYKLSGEIEVVEDGRRHVLSPGDYFFRPPYIKHGPMHTAAGTTSLIRFSGSVVNHYGPVVRPDAA